VKKLKSIFTYENFCIDFYVTVCYGLGVAGNKSATGPPLPPPGCGGEWKETGRNWWVGIRAV